MTKARVLKKKDLSLKQKKVLRSGSYKRLMEVEIPERKLEMIVEGFWYIIYEKTLTKPIVLKYGFRSKYFAESYAEKKLSKHKYNILPGSTLIKLGLERARVDLYRIGIGSMGITTYRYDYPSQLSGQRKKTLRTMYRRNYRRLLVRLLNHSEPDNPKKN